MQPTFRDIYRQITPKKKLSPKQEFVTEVAKVVLKSETTVRNWVAGVQVPDALSQKVLADYFSKKLKKEITADELFPKEAENENA